MSCPTCDHTMQRIDQSQDEYDRVYWCPRCGTLKHENQPLNKVELPKLVVRVREFLRCVTDPQVTGEARRLGVIESALPPAERGVFA